MYCFVSWIFRCLWCFWDLFERFSLHLFIVGSEFVHNYKVIISFILYMYTVIHIHGVFHCGLCCAMNCWIVIQTSTMRPELKTGVLWLRGWSVNWLVWVSFFVIAVSEWNGTKLFLSGVAGVLPSAFYWQLRLSLLLQASWDFFWWQIWTFLF